LAASSLPAAPGSMPAGGGGMSWPSSGRACCSLRSSTSIRTGTHWKRLNACAPARQLQCCRRSLQAACRTRRSLRSPRACAPAPAQHLESSNMALEPYGGQFAMSANLPRNMHQQPLRGPWQQLCTTRAQGAALTGRGARLQEREDKHGVKVVPQVRRQLVRPGQAQQQVGRHEVEVDRPREQQLALQRRRPQAAAALACAARVRALRPRAPISAPHRSSALSAAINGRGEAR